MLLRLLTHWQRTGAPVRCGAVSMLDKGPIGEDIERLGLPVYALHAGRAIPSPAALVRLARSVCDFRPDVVMTWMYHANLAGGLVTKLVSDAPVIWGVHHATTEASSLTRRTRLTVKALARVSRSVPARTVCVSHAGLEAHVGAGFARERMQVIPNGTDLNQFCRDEAAGAELRRELGIDSAATVVGLVARVHPDKDHATFFRAASLVANEHPSVQFVLCGRDATADNAVIAGEMARSGLGRNVHLLGLRLDVVKILSALDILVSSSSTEAFPLTVAEALACEVPVVVTDVGDSAWLVGNAGLVAPARSPEALAEALADMICRPKAARRELGRRGRARIAEKFEMSMVADQYLHLCEQVKDEARFMRKRGSTPSAALLHR